MSGITESPRSSLSEAQAHFERALPRRLESASADVVDEPESPRELAIRAPDGGSEDIGPGRVLHLESVENVLEFYPQIVPRSPWANAIPQATNRNVTTQTSLLMSPPRIFDGDCVQLLQT